MHNFVKSVEDGQTFPMFDLQSPQSFVTLANNAKVNGFISATTQIKTLQGNKSIIDIFNIIGYNIQDFVCVDNALVSLPSNRPIHYIDDNGHPQLLKRIYVYGISNGLKITFSDTSSIKCKPNCIFKMSMGDKEAYGFDENDYYIV